VARIVLGSYAVRFPLGGYFSWVLQWLLGFQQLGHEVYFVEKSGWPKSCYDPVQDRMGDDCSYGTRSLNAFLARFGLEDRWCFVDAQGSYHGLSERRVTEVIRSAELFLETVVDEWAEQASAARLRVLLEGEPGFTQMQMEEGRRAGEPLPCYDAYYTVGRSIGTPSSNVPTAGVCWRPIFDPVVMDLFPPTPSRPEAPFTTVMSWQAHKPFEFDGTTYHQKDVEFARFFDLPRRTSPALEIAVGGDVPEAELAQAGWRVREARAVTLSFDSFIDYIQASRGEFSVNKQVFVATRCGHFSERSAVYLACGRPVVMQDTGFSEHLPCGEGLFAVNDVEEAAAAIDAIIRDYAYHSRRAREIACEYLDARRVLGGLLRELGL
jgi:hypothetical protein